MKRFMRLFAIAVLCLGLCACGAQSDASKLVELVENQQFDEAHKLLNEMAGENAMVWAPKEDGSMEMSPLQNETSSQVPVTDIPEQPEDYEGGCEITVSNPQIATAEELLSYSDFKQDVIYEIVADIDLQGKSFPENQGCVYGIIEGNGHTISNVQNRALFHSNGGTIRNLNVDVDIHIENRVNDSSAYVAGLVSYNGGTLENCVVKGNIFVACGEMKVGGLTVDSHGTIYRCGNEANITLEGKGINPLGNEVRIGRGEVGGVAKSSASIAECYNTGDIIVRECSSVDVGGVVYSQYDVLKDCYNAGDIMILDSSYDDYVGGIGYDLSQAQTSCNFGKVKGGIVSRLMGTYLVDCYYLKSASEYGAVTNDDAEDSERIRVYALSDNEALLQENYSKLDFENVWIMGEEGYPILRWQVQE